MKSFQKSLFVISMLSVVSVSQASEGFYVGANIGQSTVDLSLNDFSFLDDGSITSASFDDSDSSLSLTLGYQLNPNIALEGGYVDLGEFSVNANSDGSGFLYAPGPLNVKLSADGLFFDVKGLVPLNEQFSLYGKLGLLKWDADVALSDSTGSITESDDGTDVFYGIGASYNVTNAVALNVDYTLYDIDGDGVDVLSAGIQVGF